MNGGESVPLVNVLYRSVEVLSFGLWSIIVVFAVHYLKIILELGFYNFGHISFLGFWIHRLSSLPVESITKVFI